MTKDEAVNAKYKDFFKGSILPTGRKSSSHAGQGDEEDDGEEDEEGEDDQMEDDEEVEPREKRVK